MYPIANEYGKRIVQSIVLVFAFYSGACRGLITRFIYYLLTL